MTVTAIMNNTGEKDYSAKVEQVAEALHAWSGPTVIVSHVDPDGDALGSTLALGRALRALGKEVMMPVAPPRFLTFLADEGELSPPLETLPEGCMLVVLDVDIGDRVTGAPTQGAAVTVNLDHHGTNPRTADVSCVEPARAATAHIVKDVVDALRVPWTPAIATPCLTGILTDTGTFRFSNTTPAVLAAAGELIGVGVAYSELTDRLQMRHPDYYRLLGKVMSTVAFPLGGRVATAQLTHEMRRELGPSEDDSDDFVGLIRYAEGTRVALFFKERNDAVKVSVRTRDGVSAQAICTELGGGGHVAAAGATLQMGLEEAKAQVLAATERELERRGF